MSDLENPYLLLTPGPLSTSSTVRQAMLRDWCTWDQDYNELVQDIRAGLLKIAGTGTAYTTVLMQGSGTFSVESVLGSVVPEKGKLLILTNGAYGERMAKIAAYLKLNHQVSDAGEMNRLQPGILNDILDKDPLISHVAFVHCETTTGMLNPLPELAKVVKQHRKVLIVDAMSSFGGIPIDIEKLGIDYLVSSANKCIQGVPGFGFIICRQDLLEVTQGTARSLSLDLYDQWATMEKGQGKWRFTSPTHTVRAFHQALQELEAEGGVQARFSRYSASQKLLTTGMAKNGFDCLLPPEWQSPVITAFRFPDWPGFTFEQIYNFLKKAGFVIYPGKISHAATFRIGNIGHVFKEDIQRLVQAVHDYRSSIFTSSSTTSQTRT